MTRQTFEGTSAFHVEFRVPTFAQATGRARGETAEGISRGRYEVPGVPGQLRPEF